MDGGTPVGGLCQPRQLLESGTAVAVPEDLGVLLGQVGEWLSDFAGTHEHDVDTLFCEVGHCLGGLGCSDVVADDGFFEAVLC